MATLTTFTNHKYVREYCIEGSYLSEKYGCNETNSLREIPNSLLINERFLGGSLVVSDSGLGGLETIR